MKKALIVGVVVALLAGCDGEQNKFNGTYSCKVSNSLNNKSIESKSEYVFPVDIIDAKITFNAPTMIIHGMKNGDYTSHEMKEVKNDGKVSFIYQEDGVLETFTPDSGAAIAFGGSESKTTTQALSDCVKN
ncbi:hypothetical protein [Providencia sp. PROV195]|uniref:hypothetical protein n=1 Tax=Providencia sp. PROV195 TaxID=2949896 RepID=UPI0023496FBF|nr:hypothetical protein [Providencia sp. PROV195]